MARSLEGKVAVVAGGSRGAGRGIALALGEAGATVYVAGRTTRGGPRPFDGAAGTIDDTADDVGRRGGRGIPVRTDCSVDADVAALFARVRDEQGRLDVVANGVWGSSQQSYDQFFGRDKRPFWELPSVGWREAIVEGAYAHLLVAQHAARLMAPAGRGLIVSVTEPNDEYAGGSLFWLFTTFGHRCINKMVGAMKSDLQRAGVAVLALAPGFMRTERVLMTIDGVPEDEREKMKETYGFGNSESTEYVGRAVVALAADPERALRKTGQIVPVGDLAREYGFTDVDGRQPHFFEEVLGKMRPKQAARKRAKR